MSGVSSMGRAVATSCANGGKPHVHRTKRELTECNTLLRRRGPSAVLAKTLRDERRQSAFEESVRSIRQLGGRVCPACGRLKGSMNFWMGAKGPDGIPIRCDDCVKRGRWGPIAPPRPAERWAGGGVFWRGVRHHYRFTRKELREAHEAMLAASEGRCHLCGIDISPRLARLDHSHHNPQRIRGILCPRCNAFLAVYEGRYGRRGRSLGWGALMRWGYSIRLEFKHRLDEYLAPLPNPVSLPLRPPPAPLTMVTMAGARCSLRGACCVLSTHEVPFQPAPFHPDHPDDLSA